VDGLGGEVQVGDEEVADLGQPGAGVGVQTDERLVARTVVGCPAGTGRLDLTAS
jgi:hypothetical protein